VSSYPPGCCYPSCKYLEWELERVRGIFGEFFPNIPISFTQIPQHQRPMVGPVNILTFKSPMVHMMLTPDALYCARHPEHLVKEAVRNQALQFAERIVEQICRAAPTPELMQ
jgi:hypothetical protein